MQTPTHVQSHQVAGLAGAPAADARGTPPRCCWCLEPIRDDDPDACHSGVDCRYMRGPRALRAR